MIPALDSTESLLIHRCRIRNNKFLLRLYRDFYQVFKDCVLPAEPVVELGSGPGFIKDIIPEATTSDIINGPDIDRTFSTEDMPFASASIGTFVMLNVFHHIKEPEQALREMGRCLKPGGRVVMIEPYNSWWGRFIYSHFHYEGFNPNAGWKIEGDGRLSDANNAMPWIVFIRDRSLFEKNFPKLKIKKITPHSPISYICSGGLSGPRILPGFCYPLVRATENLLRPLDRWCGMFATIILEKV